MATIQSDNFDRADGAVGSAWTADSGTWSIISNKLGSTGTGVVIYYNTGPGTADYQASGKCTVTNTGTGVLARRTASNTFYLFQWDAGNNRVQMYKQVSGTWTQLGSNVSFTGAEDGTDVLAISCNGTAIKGFANGIQKISVTDNAISLAGYAGFRTGGSSENFRFDDFLVEDFGGGTTTAVKDIICGFIPFAR